MRAHCAILMVPALAAAGPTILTGRELGARPAIYVGREITVLDGCRPASDVLTDSAISAILLKTARVPVLVEQSPGLQLRTLRAGPNCQARVTGLFRLANPEGDDPGLGTLLDIGVTNVTYYLVAQSVELHAARCPTGEAQLFNPAREYRKVAHEGLLGIGEAGELDFALDPDAIGLDALEPWTATVKRGSKKTREAALCVRIVPGQDRPSFQLAALDTPRNRAALAAVQKGGRLRMRGRNYGVSEQDPVHFFAAASLDAVTEAAP